jgi:PBP1b-binding outer membrane lipoprotein LpoB
MKLKFAIVLFLGSMIFSSCSKKQCPAYGQVDDTIEAESVKV